MFQLEFLEMLETMVKTQEIKANNETSNNWLENIKGIRETLLQYYKEYLTQELQEKDCCRYSEAGYDNWFQFFGDTDGYETEHYMRELFTEEECEKIWQESHK